MFAENIAIALGLSHAHRGLVAAGNGFSGGTVTRMSVPPRGARNRRPGQRPGWLLLSALLVLAILASATIVFTNKVELLRLAVILSLWAAVLAAFVSVVYRRQSELDQARSRDMKYVYDLQLDREIAARREYELSVEAHLRRQLSRELRTETGEEMAALRAELISLRSHLEALLGTDLGDRPALAAERVTIAAPAQLGRVESSRVTSMFTEEFLEVTEETITDENVTEQTITEVAVTTETIVEEVVEEVSEAAPEVEEAQPATPASPILDVPEEPLTDASPSPQEPIWQPPEYRGSHRRPNESVPAPTMPPPLRPPAPLQQPTAPWRPPETQPRRGRHWVPEGASSAQPPAPAEPVLAAQPDALRGRHRDAVDSGAPTQADQQEEAPIEDPGQHTGGHSVADLLARLQVDTQVGGGGRRRRRED